MTNASESTSFPFDLVSAPITLFEFDGLGRLVKRTRVIGAEGGSDDLVTRFEYDGRNRKTKEIDPENGETTYEYDLAGNLLSLTDPTGNVTEYQYDDWNQVTLETTTVGGVSLTRQYDYDLNGNLVEFTDRGGNTFEYDYDESDRQIEERWYDGGTLSNTITTRYDIADRLYSQVDDFSAYTYQFDALDRMTAVSNFTVTATTPEVTDVTLTSLYDADNRRVLLSASIGGAADFRNDYVYNGRDQLARLTQSGQNGTIPVGFKDVRLGVSVLSARVDCVVSLVGFVPLTGETPWFACPILNSPINGVADSGGLRTLAPPSPSSVAMKIARSLRFTNGDASSKRISRRSAVHLSLSNWHPL